MAFDPRAALLALKRDELAFLLEEWELRGLTETMIIRARLSAALNRSDVAFKAYLAASEATTALAGRGAGAKYYEAAKRMELAYAAWKRADSLCHRLSGRHSEAVEALVAAEGASDD